MFSTSLQIVYKLSEFMFPNTLQTSVNYVFDKFTNRLQVFELLLSNYC